MTAMQVKEDHEEFIAALAAIIRPADPDPYPDITYRAAQAAIDRNDITYRIWRAARDKTGQ